uniref:Uncharacterized protein n=1 Tax=Oryza punctata TaxID=4537 RepID=A0A0E0KPC5_ORYPU
MAVTTASAMAMARTVVLVLFLLQIFSAMAVSARTLKGEGWLEDGIGMVVDMLGELKRKPKLLTVVADEPYMVPRPPTKIMLQRWEVKSSVASRVASRVARSRASRGQWVSSIARTHGCVHLTLASDQ